MFIFQTKEGVRMAKVNQKIEKKHIYIAKWASGTERYVKYDERKMEYLRVDLSASQKFQTKEEAESFARDMEAAGYDKPEIIPVEVKTIA